MLYPFTFVDRMGLTNLSTVTSDPNSTFFTDDATGRPVDNCSSSFAKYNLLIEPQLVSCNLQFLPPSPLLWVWWWANNKFCIPLSWIFSAWVYRNVSLAYIDLILLLFSPFDLIYVYIPYRLYRDNEIPFSWIFCSCAHVQDLNDIMHWLVIMNAFNINIRGKDWVKFFGFESRSARSRIVSRAAEIGPRRFLYANVRNEEN